ncbi:MAG: hypothetical protein ACYCQI_13610 [Gammaproteobacteria bacterium]
MHYVAIFSIIFALSSAILWFLSALVKIPKTFPSVVVKPEMAPFGDGFGATTIGVPINPNLEKLAKCLQKQARLNALAALSTGTAVLLQAIVQMCG